jgi:single-strand selective monofunctional uracil DNA glycosylase
VDASTAKLERITAELLREVRGLRFAAPVSHVYNPLDYAREAHRQYLRRFAAPPKKVVLLGMNPGPWGMAQTGVPFGEILAVREWMGIEAKVGRPARPHPRRPVMGLACTRREVSGERLWGWARESFGAARDFFKDFFVANYCPLMFLTENGANLTPDRLKAPDALALFEACDRALRRSVEFLGPRHVVGVGRFAAGRAARALAGLPVEIGTVTHPSPANPTANKGSYADRIRAELKALGIGTPAP